MEVLTKRARNNELVTFDHRVIDGEPASRFGKALHEAIEHPGLMLA